MCWLRVPSFRATSRLPVRVRAETHCAPQVSCNLHCTDRNAPDRAIAAHARKMTALLEILGTAVLSYGNIEGGHGGSGLYPSGRGRPTTAPAHGGPLDDGVS